MHPAPAHIGTWAARATDATHASRPKLNRMQLPNSAPQCPPNPGTRLFFQAVMPSSFPIHHGLLPRRQHGSLAFRSFGLRGPAGLQSIEQSSHREAADISHSPGPHRAADTLAPLCWPCRSFPSASWLDRGRASRPKSEGGNCWSGVTQQPFITSPFLSLSRRVPSQMEHHEHARLGGRAHRSSWALIARPLALRSPLAHKAPRDPV